MSDFLVRNWVFILFVGAMLFMHFGMHGGHGRGGHGGHSGGTRDGGAEGRTGHGGGGCHGGGGFDQTRSEQAQRPGGASQTATPTWGTPQRRDPGSGHAGHGE
jgi:hypothetical protein